MIWPLPLWLNVLLGLWATVLGLLYYFLTCHFDHWKKKGVRYEKGLPFFGSLFSAMTLKEHRIHCIDKIYKKFSGECYVGFFQGRQPALLVTDPELIKSIVVKDFAHFHDHGLQLDEETNPLVAKNLFNLEGHRWKEMRSKLSPTFTSGKIKMMTPLIADVGQILQSSLTKTANAEGEIDIKEISARFTTDAIGSCVFGVQSNSIENPECTFRAMGRRLLSFDFWRGIKTLCILFVPEIAKAFKFEFIEKDLTNYFRTMVREMMDSRKKTGQSRKDFLQLLIELKERGTIANEIVEDENESRQLSGFAENYQPSSGLTNLSYDDLTAQATIFFLAGFETSSTIISFACLELAVQNEIQSKAQAEIDQVLSQHGDNLTFDALKDMVYLDCIIQETLRKYPPTGALLRTCTKNYVIPGTNVHIDKGTPVMIPIFSIQNDPKYFPDPDRFSDENALHKYQYLHMPFGDGPRPESMRFALVQMKVGLATILSKFEILPCKNTIYPPKLDFRRPIISAHGAIQLKLQERKTKI